MCAPTSAQVNPAAYAEELSAERRLPFPCGVFGCGKRFATREELQRSSNGKEMGCSGVRVVRFGSMRGREKGPENTKQRDPNKDSAAAAPPPLDDRRRLEPSSALHADPVLDASLHAADAHRIAASATGT